MAEAGEGCRVWRVLRAYFHFPPSESTSLTAPVEIKRILKNLEAETNFLRVPYMETHTRGQSRTGSGKERAETSGEEREAQKQRLPARERE